MIVRDRFSVIRASLLCGALLSVPALAQVGSGFSITVNGETSAGDPTLVIQRERIDAQLARADLRIQYDGLDIAPHLVLWRLPGGHLRTALNYPAFVERAELRFFQPTSFGPRLHSVQPVRIGQDITPAQTAPDMVAVLRVYDARGRYDETQAVALDPATPAQQAAPAEDMTARRGIPVRGGAVTVSGSDLAQGAYGTTMGETVTPDRSGRFAMQRILPPGSHAVDVAVSGAGEPVELIRPIDVLGADWFYVASADLTYALRETAGAPLTHSTTGRLAGYVSGRFANGVELTAQVDTGEGPLGRLLSDLDERDPRSLFLRVDPDDLYPTYGDDSTMVDDTPTSGRVYVRIERDNSYLLWGDYKASLQGGYLRNERSLYGLSAAWESDHVTSDGEPRASFRLYAAQPERLAQRDVMRGTGGSVYFLNRQDISIGSETVSVQIRDRETGRVVETQKLIAGVDYAINYIQGVVTLRAPLSGSAGGRGLVQVDPTRGQVAQLVVSYEFSPSSGDLDAFAYGGRVEAWLTDTLRLGTGAMGEHGPLGDQRLQGADLHWQAGRNSFVALDYGISDGPGRTRSVSDDGGLQFDTSTSSGGTGEAYRLDAQLDLEDLGGAMRGQVAGYMERRTAGFTSLDYAVTVDESLWGLSFDTALTDRFSVLGQVDSYAQTGGKTTREGEIALVYALDPAWDLGVGIAHLDRAGGRKTGRRSDLALRLTYAPDEDREVYGFVQRTVARAGALPDNHRVGFGGKAPLGQGWAVEGDLSVGTLGTGARVLLRHEAEGAEEGVRSSRYVGYELEPERSLSGVALSGTDRGRLIYGWQRDYGGGLSAFGEHGFDMFGNHNALNAAYGLNYQVSDQLRYAAAFEYGHVDDPENGDFTRRALSFGVGYDGPALTASGRFEYRHDQGGQAGRERDSRTVVVVSDLAYEFDDDQRVVVSLDGSVTRGSRVVSQDGELVDVKLGYAFRPVEHERLNMLLRYRFLLDSYGRQLEGGDRSVLQRSHVLSAEASYDLSDRWTLGGKFGHRVSRVAQDDSSPWVANDASLAVANLRYHFAHNWDALIELRGMHFAQSGTMRSGAMGAVYRHLGPNLMLGVGVEYGSVSSDLTDFDFAERGAFVNLVASF